MGLLDDDILAWVLGSTARAQEQIDAFEATHQAVVAAAERVFANAVAVDEQIVRMHGLGDSMLELIVACSLIGAGALGGTAIFWFGLWIGNRSTGIVPVPPLAQRKPPEPPKDDPSLDDRPDTPIPFFQKRQG